MQRKSNEMWIALLLVGVISAAYMLVTLISQEIPRASSIFGHGLGIIGFFLMIITEVLYSIRKRRNHQRRSSLLS